ncbi:MAG: M23 family metallopeptidase [Candidatus Nitrospinota bacterium M3_3B_026]
MAKDGISGAFSKKYTLIFVPDITGRFIRFSVPKFLAKGLLAFGLVSLGVFGYFSYTVIQKSENLDELARLRQAAAAQKLEIQKFRKKVKQVEVQLARLEKFDKKLRVITSLESQAPDSSEYGTGGPYYDDPAGELSPASKYTESLMDALNNDLGRIKQKARAQEISFFELDEFFKEQSSLLTHTPSVWPARGWVTSTFGYRRSPFTGLREMHEGIDIATQLKAPVIAPANGIVIRVGFHPGYGKLVELDHGYGVVTRYGHNSKNLVEPGQKIKRGEIIALVGSTGRSTGPHLHYEVLLNGVPVNPYRYILEN